MENVLEIKGLNKAYASFSLQDVTFSMPQGSIMAFIGRNGAGKTTTIKAILNFIKKDSGKICIFGLDNIESELQIKKSIGYAGGGVDFYKNKKIKDVVAVTKTFYDHWDDEAYKKYAQVFMLDENKLVKQLSQGMKVKLNLALALSHGAKLLILDEPTSGLDPVSRDEILSILEKLNKKGVSVLFSTHITSDLEKCATHVTYIQQGKIVACEEKEKFIKLFGGKTLEEIMINQERREIDL